MFSAPSTIETKLSPYGDLKEFAATKSRKETSNNKQRVYIIRGLPGSGKSTLAALLADIHCTEDWYEADMYFEGSNGYKFEGDKIGDAHDWCHYQFSNALFRNSHCVIVSNTFTRYKEYIEYVNEAKAYNYDVQILHCEGSFGSTHGVPEKVIRNMSARWERHE